jgi:di/tricarboxylate transporter
MRTKKKPERPPLIVITMLLVGVYLLSTFLSRDAAWAFFAPISGALVYESIRNYFD